MAKEVLHGVEVDDPFRHLEDAADPEVEAWTAEQDAAARRHLAALPGRDAFKARIVELSAAGRVAAPAIAGRRIFHLRRDGMENQPSLYVRESWDAPPRRLIDVNALSADGTKAMDWFAPSADGSLVAYGTSEGGSELSTLRVRRLDGTELPDVIPWTRGASVAWLRDGSGFYYTRYPEKDPYHRHVRFHRLGTDPAEDPMVFGEGRAKEDWPSVALGGNDRWLLVTVSMGWRRTEVYAKDRLADGPWLAISEGRDALSWALPAGDRVYVRTNDGSPNYRIDEVRLPSLERRVLVPEGAGALEYVAATRDGLVVLELRDAWSRGRRIGFDGRELGPLDLPPLGSVAELAADDGGSDFALSWQSFTEPPRLLRGSLATASLLAFESAGTATEAKVAQEWCRSKDGTRVPMFVISRGGGGPVLLTGYGGFNISRTPAYSPAVAAWVERGGTWVTATLRGGGEFGETWHRAGMLEHKQNDFDDFIACAEHLRPRGPLAILGGSNGGLLVGAALTQRPELFGAVVCSVPVLDMIRYHRFLIARLWIPEYGCAEEPAQFPYLLAYSPYHRVVDGTKYPAVLLATGEHDSRVDPMHAKKMAARLQRATSSGRPVLLRVERQAGHGQGKPLDKSVEESADLLAFAWSEGGKR